MEAGIAAEVLCVQAFRFRQMGLLVTDTHLATGDIGHAGVSGYFFFFQAEDGIRDDLVTGVQTCALPISYAGIPLTARGFASSVRFLTYTHPEVVDEKQIRELASSDDTLVLYMASKNLPQLVTRLLKNEISEEKWVAVVEQATTPGQKVFSYPVKEFLSRTRERRFRSPSIIIIGKVAKLNQQFNWFSPSKVEENFFPTVQTDFLNTAKVA